MPRFKKRRLHDELLQEREYNAQKSPKSELCEFKWANTHNKCVHYIYSIYSMQLANWSPNPYLMWLHYIWCRIKLGPKL